MRPKDIVILLAPVGIVVLALIVAPLLLLPNGIQIGSGAVVPAPGTAGGPGAIGGGGASPVASPGEAGSAPGSSSGSPVAQGGGGDAANGAKLFVTKGCAACHTISDIPGASGKVGPDLSHIGTVGATMKPGEDANAYIRESILDPTAFTVEGFPEGVMPKIPMTDQELNDIVAMLLAHK